tara:strand:- start:8301 stop:9533 length:1233 start_codon:yes stop_codon:yes gene_type:complete
MSNLIFDLTNNFDFSVLNLGNPSLLNNNNYFSKISHGSMNKNFYLQLPKCITKQGIIKGNNKNYCDLIFNSNDKNIIEFFENLENYCVNEIHKNKDLWFYDSDNMNIEDIQELISPIMRSYKSGKNFLIKTNIKLDKLNIYDENETKITLDDYNSSNELIPLLTVNGIKFSSKSFIIELLLIQIMVVYPADEFEKQMLINVNETKTNNLKSSNILTAKTDNILERLDKQCEHNDNDNDNDNVNENVNENDKDNENDNENDNDKDNELVEQTNDDLTKQTNDDLAKQTNDELAESRINNLSEQKNDKLEDTKKNDSEFKFLINNDLDNSTCNEEIVDMDDLEINDNVETIQLKSYEAIYLEIYKKAKQKAKEIRKNAIEAFLEAKNIKAKYNLDSLNESDSSDEEEFMDMS